MSEVASLSAVRGLGHIPTTLPRVIVPVISTLPAATEEALGPLALRHARPWEREDPLDSLSIRVDFTGPEAKGLSRAERRLWLAAA